MLLKTFFLVKLPQFSISENSVSGLTVFQSSE